MAKGPPTTLGRCSTNAAFDVQLKSKHSHVYANTVIYKGCQATWPSAAGKTQELADLFHVYFFGLSGTIDNGSRLFQSFKPKV